MKTKIEQLEEEVELYRIEISALKKKCLSLYEELDDLRASSAKDQKNSDEITRCGIKCIQALLAELHPIQRHDIIDEFQRLIAKGENGKKGDFCE